MQFPSVYAFASPRREPLVACTCNIGDKLKLAILTLGLWKATKGERRGINGYTRAAINLQKLIRLIKFGYRNLQVMKSYIDDHSW